MFGGLVSVFVDCFFFVVGICVSIVRVLCASVYVCVCVCVCVYACMNQVCVGVLMCALRWRVCVRVLYSMILCKHRVHVGLIVLFFVCCLSPVCECFLHVSAFWCVLFFLISSGGWVKIKLKLPHFHVSDTCCVSI